MAAPILAAIPFAAKALGAGAAAGAGVTGYRALTRDEEQPPAAPAIPETNPLAAGLPPALRQLYDRGAEFNRQVRPPPPPPAPPAPPEASWLDRGADLAVNTTAAIPETARSLVGLANIPFDSEALGGAEQWLQRQAENIRDTGLSDAGKAEKQRFAEQLAASNPGFWNEFGNAISAAVDNPWVAANMLPGIIMQMTVGARGAGMLMPKASPLLRAAVGEGAIAAGMASAEIGEQGGNRLYAAPIGVATGAISGVGGTLLNKMAGAGGVTGRIGTILNAADPEQVLAGGARTAGSAVENTNKSLLARMGAGAFREGVLEELPQTMQEQVLQNIAVGKDPMEGVGTEAGLGTLLGGAMGAGFNIPRAPGPQPPDTDAPPVDVPPGGPTATDTPTFDAPPGAAATEPPAPEVPPYTPAAAAAATEVDTPADTGTPPEDTTPRASPERVAQAIDEQMPLTAQDARSQIEAEIGYSGRLFGDKVWNAVTESLPEAPTQADVETSMEAARGVGDARKDRIRNTDWYKALPPAPGEAPAPVTEAVPDDVDPDGYEVEQGLRSIMSTMQTAGVPDPVTGFETKPEIVEKAGLRTLYRMIENVFTLDTVYGKPTKQRGQAQRAAYVRNMVEANPEQYPVGLEEVVTRLHEGMKALSSANSQGTMSVDNQRGRYTKAPGENLAAREALVDQVETDLRTFVNMVGANNVRAAMALGKTETRNKTRLVTKVNKDRLGSEDKPAVRFGAYMAALEDGRLRDGAMSGRLIREENTLARRLGSDTKFADILAGKTVMTRVKNSTEQPVTPAQPLRNLVQHFRFSSFAPQGLTLFKAIDSAFRDKGLYDPQKLVLESVDEDAPNGVGAAQFLPGVGGSIGTIRIYANGRSEKAIGHEVIHAVTVASIYDDPQLTRPEHRNLLGIAEQLRESLQGVDFASEYGTDAQIAAAAIVASLNSSTPDAQLRAVAELVSYGLTDGGLQRWMRETELNFEAARTRQAAGSSVWSAFVNILRKLVGAGAVQNSVFEQFVRSSAVTLSKAEMRTGGIEPGQNLAPFNVDVSPDTAADLDPEAQQAALDAYLTHRTASVKQQRDVDDLTSKEEQERRRKWLEMTADQARTPVTGSAVPATPGAAKRARGVTVVDRAAVGVADSLAYVISDGRYTTWADLATSGYEGVSSKFKHLVSADPDSPFSPLKTLVGRFMGLTVDKFDVPVLQQGLNHKLHRVSNVEAETLARFSRLPAVLADFPQEGHQALMDFLDTDGGEAAVSELRSRTSEAVAEMSQMVHQMLTHYRREAVALGTMSVDDAQKPLISLLRDPAVQAFFFRTDVDVNRFRTVSDQVEFSYAHEGSEVGTELIITQDGEEVFDATALGDRQFLPAFHQSGTVVRPAMVEVGTPVEVMDEAGVVLRPDDRTTYTAAGPKGQGVTFSHRKTYAERRASNKHADAFVALATTAHELVRHVELNKLFRGYATVNEGILTDMEDARARLRESDPALTEAQIAEAVPDSRWLRDTPPEEFTVQTEVNGQPAMVPDARRVFDLGDANVRNKVGSRNAFRAPGTWVRIPKGKAGKLKPFDLGPLEGQYMYGPAYAALLDTLDPSPIISSRSLRAAQSVFKLANTVLSPVFYTNSLLSNVLTGYAENLTMSQIWAGFRLSVIQQWPDSNAAKEYARQLGPMAAIAEESREMGILLGQARAEEFGTDFEQELAKLEVSGGASIRDLTRGMVDIHNWMARAARSVEALKGASSVLDNAFRNAKYIQQVAAWREANPGQAVPEEVKLQAAERARKSFVDYQIDAPVVKLLRETVLPFVVFPYRWVGLLSKMIVTQPWKVATMSATIGALNGLMAMLAGGPDNDEMQEGLQEWQRGNVWWMPGVDVAFRMPFNVAGNPTVWDLRTIVPGSTFLETNNSGVPDTFTPGGPLGVLAAVLMNKDAFFGREIWSETDTGAEIAAKMGKYIAAPFIPRVARIAAQSVQRETGEEVGSLGQSRAGWTNYAKVLGINAGIVNMDEGRHNNARARQFILRDYNTKIRRLIKDETLGKDPDWDVLLDDIADINEQMMERLEEFDNG